MTKTTTISVSAAKMVTHVASAHDGLRTCCGRATVYGRDIPIDMAHLCTCRTCKRAVAAAAAKRAPRPLRRVRHVEGIGALSSDARASLRRAAMHSMPRARRDGKRGDGRS